MSTPKGKAPARSSTPTADRDGDQDDVDDDKDGDSSMVSTPAITSANQCSSRSNTSPAVESRPLITSSNLTRTFLSSAASAAPPLANAVMKKGPTSKAKASTASSLGSTLSRLAVQPALQIRRGSSFGDEDGDMRVQQLTPLANTWFSYDVTNLHFGTCKSSLAHTFCSSMHDHWTKFVVMGRILTMT